MTTPVTCPACGGECELNYFPVPYVANGEIYECGSEAIWCPSCRIVEDSTAWKAVVELRKKLAKAVAALREAWDMVTWYGNSCEDDQIKCDLESDCSSLNAIIAELEGT